MHLNNIRNQIINDKNWVYIDFDGSSEELFKYSVFDLLKKKIGSSIQPDKKYQIVIDEYHLMTKEQQQKALIFFTSNGLDRLVLISNRYDYSDRELLAKYFEKPQIIIACSLDSERITKYFQSEISDQSEKSALFITSLFTVLRNILGENMVSYRFTKSVATYYKQNNNGKIAEEIQNINQTLKLKFCTKLVKRVLFLIFSLKELKTFSLLWLGYV